MFSGIRGKLLIVFYILILIAIPIGAYLVSQNQNPHASAHGDSKTDNPLAGLKPLTSTPSASKNPLGNLGTAPSSQPSASPSLDTTFGPTLNLKLVLQGRPEGKNATKLFVGIVEGTISQGSSPKYILSFNIDLPDSGAYTGLSLAGLNPGNSYSAILKAPAQIATSSAFVMSPSVTNLNGGNAITLLTGDLNEDNVVNSADYSIAKQAYGATSTSPNWNPNVDFNADGVVNVADIAIMMKNFNNSGQTGIWVSPPPPSSSPTPGGGPESTLSATTSATPNGPIEGNGGYWFWMPKL